MSFGFLADHAETSRNTLNDRFRVPERSWAFPERERDNMNVKMRFRIRLVLVAEYSQGTNDTKRDKSFDINLTSEYGYCRSVGGLGMIPLIEFVLRMWI